MVFLIIIFFFPVAVYCSVLAAVNRRTQPLMVAGTWDFAGLLFALSGFLLVTGPALVVLFYRNIMGDYLLRGSGKDLSERVIHVLGNWPVYWGLYYGLLIAGAGTLLWLRHRTTVIYNVRPEDFENVFLAVLRQLRLPSTRRGKTYYLGDPQAGANEDSESDKRIAEAAAAEHITRAPGSGPDTPLPAALFTGADGATTLAVTVDPFPLFYNVSLHWRGGPGARDRRDEIEAELGKALAQVASDDNPVAGWLLALSAVLFLVMIFSMGLVIFFSLYRPNAP